MLNAILFQTDHFYVPDRYLPYGVLLPLWSRNPCSPCDGWGEWWLVPGRESLMWVYCIVQPPCRSIFDVSIFPSFEIIVLLCSLNWICPSDEEVKVEMFTVCEGFHCYCWVGCRQLELELGWVPFQGAATVVVYRTKDAVVPFEEVGFFMIEEMEFGQEEAIEVLEHEGCWWLLGWRKPAPVEEGLDGAVTVRVASIQEEGDRGEGWF